MTAPRSQGRRPSASKSGDRAQNLEKRKLRNRISQQAFRTRQNLKVQELEERMQDLSRPDAARITQLQDQNAALRDQLFECHKKLTSFEISLQDLKGAVAQALGLPTRERDTTSRLRNGGAQSDKASTTASIPVAETSEDDDGSSSLQVETAPVAPVPATSNIIMPNGDATNSEFTDALPLSSTSIVEGYDWFATSTQPQDYAAQLVPCNSSQQGISNNETGNTNYNEWNKLSRFSLQTQSLTPPGIGIAAYHNIMDTLSIMPKPQSAVSSTNSQFSDHIDALELVCLQNWAGQNGSGLMSLQISKIVHFMLSAFVSISWSSMIGWHSRVRALVPLRDIMVWRLNKTLDAYLSIVPSYRPTKLQMSVRYPSIIDWTPWPSLRDKLIIHHSANPRLDDLICEIGNSYVVPADLSKLVVCPQPIHGYVNVWHIVHAIDSPATAYLNGESTDSVEGITLVGRQWLDSVNIFQNILKGVEQDGVTATEQLPAPDANALFSSRRLAVQAFKQLGMDQGAFNFRLDPKFFENHPELYSAEDDLMAYGVALRADTVTKFPGPQDLDSVVIKRYEELSKHALDAANASVLAGV